MAKENVISFRVSDEQFDALKKRYDADLPAGMGETKTPNKMARKIVLDSLAGRTTYVNDDDRYSDVDALNTEVKAQPVMARAGSGRKK